MPGKKNQSWANKGNRLTHQHSRDMVMCVVPECSKLCKRYKLKEHYTNTVLVDEDNKPLRPSSETFKRIQQNVKKIHTKYFHLHNLDPATSKACRPAAKDEKSTGSPFVQMEQRRLQKKSLDIQVSTLSGAETVSNRVSLCHVFKTNYLSKIGISLL